MSKFILLVALACSVGCKKNKADPGNAEPAAKVDPGKPAPAASDPAKPAAPPAEPSAADPTKPDPAKLDESMAELSALRDKMCACKDKACAEAVNKEVDAYFARDRQRFTAEQQMAIPADKKSQLRKLEDEQYQCWQKLKG